MSYQFILYEVDDRLATITLNRPDKRNALSNELTPALRQMLLAMVQDARVVLIKLADEVSLLHRLAREGSEAARRSAARDTFESTRCRRALCDVDLDSLL